MSRATKDSRLKRAGVSGYNKPKRTPSHPKKSHIVVAKEGDKVKTIRFGQQGVKTAGKPKKGESSRKPDENLSKQDMQKISKKERCLRLGGPRRSNGDG